MTINDQRAVYSIMGINGRMISGSKSGYTNRYPDNLVVFNANVCTSNEKIWYGDLDITKDSGMLQDLANSFGREIYVLREMDARFENEANPKLDRAVAKFSPED